MGQDIKLCTDCKHRRGSISFPVCGANIYPVEVDLVTGEESGEGFWSCRTSRNWADMCGPAGWKWKAKVQKPSLLQRLKVWLSK